MKQRFRLRPLSAAMNDSFSRAELYAAFESQAFSRAQRMDVPLLRETLRSLDDREDGEAAPHQALVWQKIVHRIMKLQQPIFLGLNRRGVALLIAIVLLLSTAAALALSSWTAIIERVYHLEQQESRVENWTLEQKRSIADALRAADYDMTSLPDLASMNEQEQDSALTEWLNEQFEGEVTAGHYNLMTRLKGFLDDWSLEDKAWYYQLLVREGEVFDGEFISCQPPEGYRGAEEAKAIAQQLLREAYDGTDLDADALIPYLFYGCLYPDDSVRYWRVHYRSETGANWFTVLVRDNVPPEEYEGIVAYRAPTLAELDAIMAENSRKTQERRQRYLALVEERGESVTWSFEQQAEWDPDAYGVPGEDDIAPEEAYAIARRVYCQVTGASPEEAEKLYLYSFFLVYGDRPCYSISFFRDREAHDLISFSITIYADGEVKTYTTETNG